MEKKEKIRDMLCFLDNSRRIHVERYTQVESTTAWSNTL